MSVPVPNPYPCGHPRTDENSKPHGNGRACRTCRRVIERAAQARRRAAKSRVAQAGRSAL